MAPRYTGVEDFLSCGTLFVAFFKRPSSVEPAFFGSLTNDEIPETLRSELKITLTDNGV